MTTNINSSNGHQYTLLPATLMILAALAATMLLAASTAAAQENRAGRYTMHKADDGFVRLDTETGAVALCQKTDAGWGCKNMTGGPASSGSSSETVRLSRENAELKAEIKRMEELLGLRGERDRYARNSPSFKLPSEQEVDQALNYFERMLKKFQDRLKRLENKEVKPERQL